jgi:DNA-binding MarR family transcriptional regulator
MQKDRVNISRSLIEKATQENWLTTLHYYILIRKLYKTPHIYNYSCRKLSKLTGVSTSVISHHVKIMLSKGIAHVHNGNLCFISQQNVNKLINKGSAIVNLPFDRNKRRMILELRGVLIVRNLDSQKIHTHTRFEIVRKCKNSYAQLTRKEKKILREEKGALNIEKNINARITLSNKGIGKILKRSQSTGKRIQRGLNELGIIHSSQYIVILSDKFHPEMLRYQMNGCFKTINNEFVKQYSNTIWSPYGISSDKLKMKIENTFHAISSSSKIKHQ